MAFARNVHATLRIGDRPMVGGLGRGDEDLHIGWPCGAPPPEKKLGGLPGPEFPHFAGQILHRSAVRGRPQEGDQECKQQ